MSELNGGYIRLYRELLENPVWTQLVPAVAKVAIYSLLRANYKAIQWYDGCAAIDIPAGSFITSLEKTAIACNISVQQVRDAFAHLARTQFATYRRTHRWTLVTVLDWSVYQASAEDENTLENTEENTPENRQRTLNKKERSKNNTPYPLKGAGNGVPTDPDELPFATTLEPFPPEVNGKNHNSAAAKPDLPEAIHQTAARIHQRHPNNHLRRDCSVARVAKLLAAILKHQHIPVREQEAYLERIDRNHAAMCTSETWQKDGGQFVKSLEKWLAPAKELYLVEPPASATGQGVPPRIVL